MSSPAAIPLTTPRLQLSFWASAPQTGLPDYGVRSALPRQSQGPKDIFRKPRERGSRRVQRQARQLLSQPHDGGDQVRPQAGPTWHGSPSPGPGFSRAQALLRAVRTEGRTMHAPRTQERVRPAPPLPLAQSAAPSLPGGGRVLRELGPHPLT